MRLKWLFFWSGTAVILAAFTGPHVVPLFDGVGFPDEPYRYVGISGTLPPTGVTQSISIGDLNQYGAAASSQEMGPQLSIYFQQHSVKLSAGDSFTINAAPLAAGDQPQPGAIAGNVYSVSASAKSAKPQFDSSKSDLFLRLPSNKPMNKVAIVYRPGSSGKWQTQFTVKTGNDIFKSDFRGPGEYALATGLDMPSKTAPQSGFGGPQPWLRYLPWILFAGLVIAIILVIRFRKPKSHSRPHD